MFPYISSNVISESLVIDQDNLQLTNFFILITCLSAGNFKLQGENRLLIKGLIKGYWSDSDHLITGLMFQPKAAIVLIVLQGTTDMKFNMQRKANKLTALNSRYFRERDPH